MAVTLDDVSVPGGPIIATEPLTSGEQLPISGLVTTDGLTWTHVSDANALPVASPGLAPPVGGTMTADASAHALGSLTGAGFVVIINEGPGLVMIGDSSAQTAPVGIGSYSYKSVAVQNIRYNCPVGTVGYYSVHQ